MDRQGSLTSQYDIDIINDRRRSDGWELLYSTFDSNASGPLKDPYFILYNKYRGTMRVFLYLTTQFVTLSSYLQDGISVLSTSPTSILNFLGEDIIDATTNKAMYSQVQSAPDDGTYPMAANKWYMFQYEIAFDPNLPSIPYDNILLSWNLNYITVSKISIGGTQEGTINGTIGAAGPNQFSGLGEVAKTIGTGALAGLGTKFLDKSSINENTGENKLGLNNSIFKSLFSGVKEALSKAAGGLPGVAMGLLSGIIGGSGGTTSAISLTMKTEITLIGTSTAGGSFPSSPISFLVPGTDISPNAVEYLPIYDKVMGVVNFSGKPEITIRHEVLREWQEPDEPFNPEQMMTITE